MRTFSIGLLLSLALLPFSVTAQEDAGGAQTAETQSTAEADVQLFV